MWPSAKDALRLLATVRFPVIQFNPVQQPFMTFGIVPIAVIHFSTKWSFEGLRMLQVARSVNAS